MISFKSLVSILPYLIGTATSSTSKLSKRAFQSLHHNGQITQYDTGGFSQQHCLGNTEARKSFLRNRPGGENDPISKIAISTNKWVALNDINLGPGFSNCGKCVSVTISLKKAVDRIDHTASVGPLLVADRCYECANNAIDLKSAAYASLGIPNGRGSIQPQHNDEGTTVMVSSWHPVNCSEPYAVVRKGGAPQAQPPTVATSSHAQSVQYRPAKDSNQSPELQAPREKSTKPLLSQAPQPQKPAQAQPPQQQNPAKVPQTQLPPPSPQLTQKEPEIQKSQDRKEESSAAKSGYDNLPPSNPNPPSSSASSLPKPSETPKTQNKPSPAKNNDTTKLDSSSENIISPNQVLLVLSLVLLF